MKKQQSAAHPLMKKHHRIKSQEIVSVCSQIQTVFKQTLNRAHPRSHSFHLIQVVKPTTGEYIKVVIEGETGLKRVKQLLSIKIGIQASEVYFYSEEADKSFDYCLEEGIGNLEKGIRLAYAKISCQKDENGNFIESNQISDYFIHDCLSVGGFSKVFLVRSKKSGKFYAAKFVDKNFDHSQKFQELIYNEKYINEVLDYQLLVKMHSFIETEQFYIFILDYCPSGELFCLMKNHREMSESSAKFYFIETVLAIEYIHSKSIIYRDIKPENILLDKNGHIKLADFGLSKVMRQKSTSYCGSLQYMAPEIVLGIEHSFGVDHYCLGSLLFEIMVGCPPFYNPNFTPSQTKYHIVNSEVKFPSSRKFSPQLMDLICRLLDKNPKTRLGSLGGIREIFAHPWIGKFDRTKYESYQIDPPYKISLNQSNFQTALLPIQAIEQVKQRINKQIEEKNKVNFGFQKPKRQNEVQPSLLKTKSSQPLREYSTSCGRIKKVELQNPYQMIAMSNGFNKKNSLRSPKLLIKSQAKTFHNSPNFIHKNRSLTKNFEKQGRLSNGNENNDNFCKKKRSKQSFLKSYLNKQDFKRSNNTTLHRKSGNCDKQNILKIKFEKKSKLARQFFGKNVRGSLNQQRQDYQKTNQNKYNEDSRTQTKSILR